MVVDRASVEAALPAYEIGDVVGAGSFGSVRVGRHRGLGRSVAIKVLTPRPDGVVEESRDRFSSEAQILAGIDHPHVVRVFDYVERGNLRLLVMENLSGGTLSTRMAAGPVTAELACAVGLSAAEALDCAHSAGILHRDVKPDNILFAGDGTVKVADFGIAKMFGGSAVSASAVAGTFGFMPPEQIRAGRLAPSSDLYALGVVLYRLLSGRMPFDVNLPLDRLLRLQMETRPPRPAGVVQPLADVVMHVLATDVDDRPPSARAFALELAEAAREVLGPAWLARAGSPVHLSGALRDAATGARIRVLSPLAAVGVDVPPKGFTRERLSELDLRNKDLRGADLSGVDMSGVRLAGTDLSGARLREASLVGAVLERVCLVRADLSGADLSRARLVRADLSAATFTGSRWHQACLLSCTVDAEVASAPELAGSVRPGRDPVTVNVAPSGNPSYIAVAPQESVAAVTWGSAVALLDLTERRLTRVFPGDDAIRGAAAFSRDGTLLAGLERSAVHIWGLESNYHRAVLLADGPAATGLCFTASSRLLAVENEEGGVRVYLPDSGVVCRSLTSISDVGVTSAFSVDGELFARSSGYSPIEVLEVDTGRRRAELRGYPCRLAALRFSPDGKRLAGASDDGVVRVWDLASGRAVRELHGQAVGVEAYETKLSFAPGGDLLAVGPTLLEIGTGRTRTLQSEKPLRGPVVFNRNGSLLAAADRDGSLLIWDASSGRRGNRTELRTAVTHNVLFSLDQTTVLGSTRDGAVSAWGAESGERLWEATSRRRQTKRNGTPREVTAVLFSPDGKNLVTSGSDGQVRIWEIATVRQRERYRLRWPVVALAASPDGELVAAADQRGDIRVWDVATGRELVTQFHGSTSERINGIAFSQDGCFLAAATANGAVKIVHAASGEHHSTVSGHQGAVNSVSFSPGGRLVASASADHTVRLWEMSSGRQQAAFSGHQGAVNSVSFSPDGRLAASASADHTVRLWEPSGTCRSVRRHSDAVNCAAFSPDGRLFASASEDRTVKVWDVRTGEHKMDLLGHAGGVKSVAFHPSGHLLASASGDGEVRMFDTETGHCLVRLVGTDDGWATLLQDGSYKIGGGAVDSVWWTVARSRFDAGELDPHSPSIRWLDDDTAIPLPSGRRKRRRT